MKCSALQSKVCGRLRINGQHSIRLFWTKSKPTPENAIAVSCQAPLPPPGFPTNRIQISAVADFGSKLDASSRMVAEAVSQLPATINSSVVRLSAEVTRDISV